MDEVNHDYDEHWKPKPLNNKYAEIFRALHIATVTPEM